MGCLQVPRPGWPLQAPRPPPPAGPCAHSSLDPGDLRPWWLRARGCVCEEDALCRAACHLPAAAVRRKKPGVSVSLLCSPSRRVILGGSPSLSSILTQGHSSMGLQRRWEELPPAPSLAARVDPRGALSPLASLAVERPTGLAGARPLLPVFTPAQPARHGARTLGIRGLSPDTILGQQFTRQIGGGGALLSNRAPSQSWRAGTPGSAPGCPSLWPVASISFISCHPASGTTHCLSTASALSPAERPPSCGCWTFMRSQT